MVISSAINFDNPHLMPCHKTKVFYVFQPSHCFYVAEKKNAELANYFACDS